MLGDVCMLVKLYANDPLFNLSPFTDQEVAYNLVHRICDSADSDSWKSPDNKLIIAQNPGYNAWLWAAGDVEPEERMSRIRQLAEHLKNKPLPGISGAPDVAEAFAIAYAQARGVPWRENMQMEAYRCPILKKPIGVNGSFRKATQRDAETVAEFLAGFAFDAFGATVRPSSQLKDAKESIQSGSLYLWQVQGLPVAMANIAHRSARHARINSVYTPRNHRKQGYASAVVAELCALAAAEGLTPMLYADLRNPDSNRLYRRIGFVASGKIKDIKLTEE